MTRVHKYLDAIKKTLDRLDDAVIERAIDLLHEARTQQRQIFIMGNGGSASTASHFACDLAKNTRHSNLPPCRVIGLADNMAILSAFANDEGYENVFARQLENLVRAKDVVIGISTSGNSLNVLRAVELANQKQAVTIGFTGFDAGGLGDMVDLHLHVPSHCIEHVEDIHLMLEHLITRALRDVDDDGPWLKHSRKQLETVAQ